MGLNYRRACWEFKINRRKFTNLTLKGIRIVWIRYIKSRNSKSSIF